MEMIAYGVYMNTLTEICQWIPVSGDNLMALESLNEYLTLFAAPRSDICAKYWLILLFICSA